MVLENKFGIKDSLELAKTEEKVSKEKAKRLFEEELLVDKQAGALKPFLLFTAFSSKISMILQVR